MDRKYKRVDGVLATEAGDKLHRSDTIVVRSRLEKVRRVATNGPTLIMPLLDDTDRDTIETAYVLGELNPQHHLTIVESDGTGTAWRHPLSVSFNGRGSPDDKSAGQLFCFTDADAKDGPVDSVSIGFYLPPERFEWLWKKLGELGGCELKLTFRLSGWQWSGDFYNSGEVDFPTMVLDRTEPHPIHVVELEVSDPVKPEPVMVENDKGELVPPPTFVLDPKVVRYLGWTVPLLVMLLLVSMLRR